MTRALAWRRARVVAGVAVAAALVPATAEAHLVSTGLGPVYDGISHVLMSPDDLVPILAMAMLAGLNGPTAGRRTLMVLTGAWLLAGVGGYLAGQAPVLAATTLSFLVLGGLIALDARLSPRLVTTLSATVGVLHGWLNGASLAQTTSDPSGLLGIAAATFVLVALAAAAVIGLRAPWQRIAVRVLGSWVAAIGLLILGWTLRASA